MYKLLMLLCAVVVGACAVSTDVRVNSWTVNRDLPYVDNPHANQMADVYLPDDGQAQHPAVLLIHGGGWSGGERADVEKYAKRLVKAGYVVANISYRFAPEFKFPAQTEDVAAAWHWLQAHAHDFAIDPQRVGVMGYSAGGHLALMLGLSDDDTPQGAKAIVSGAGPTDVTLYTDSPYMRRLIGEYKDHKAEYRAASPLFLASPNDPPTLMFHGQWDKLVEIGQSQAMAKALDELGVENQLIEVPFAGHITNFLFDGSTWPQIQAFLDQHLGP